MYIRATPVCLISFLCLFSFHVHSTEEGSSSNKRVFAFSFDVHKSLRMRVKEDKERASSLFSLAALAR